MRRLMCACPGPGVAAERGDRLLVSLQYFHPLHFDASTGDYVLQLPTDIPQVGWQGQAEDRGQRQACDGVAAVCAPRLNLAQHAFAISVCKCVLLVNLLNGLGCVHQLLVCLSLQDL